MRFSQAPPTLLSLLAIILTSAHSTTAKPYPRDDSTSAVPSGLLLEERACAIPCGWNGLCCAQGQTCTTDSAGGPLCGSGGGAAVAAGAATTVAQVAVATTAAANAAGGQWQYYTSTWVETNLVTKTSVYSSFIGAAATTYQPAPTAVVGASTATCNYALNETPCGNICCSGQQHCMSAGQCAAGAGGSSNNKYYTETVSPALRPTSSGVLTVTATTTGPFQTPVPTGTAGSSLTGASAQASGGLSGGAIAGIVIGVIAGIILLLLLCAACCFKAGIDGLLALFGLGSKRRRRTEETYIEERHSHHGHGGGRPSRTWYGGAAGPSRPPQKKSSGAGGLGAVGAGLAALAVVLGLKRRQGRNDKSSYGSGSSYYSSDYTSSSK